MSKKNILVLVGISTFSALVFYFFKPSIVRQNQPDRIELIKRQKNLSGFDIKPTLFTTEYIIINFWATWCPPCIQETPSLIDFVKSNKEFSLVAFSQDDSVKEIQDFLKLFPDFKQPSLDVVFDETKEVSRAFEVVKLPETFIYSFKTKKSIQISGATDWKAAGIKEKILEKIN